MPEFTFDGKAVPYQPGDTFGSALHRAGIKVLSRSLKYHRPRGLYCCTGSCASCYVDVDGEPNVPACMRAACPAVVTSQNRLGSAKHDLYAAADKVFRSGFDPHDMMTRPRILNEAFLRVVRHMSGLGRAPKDGAHSKTRAARRGSGGGSTAGPVRRQLAVDELIVGGGQEGLHRAREAGQARVGRVLLVDEMPELGGSASWDPLEAGTRDVARSLAPWQGVESWTSSVCFGLYNDPGAPIGLVAGIMRPGPAGHDLWEVRPRRITIAPGRHDSWPVFENNDLPGVLSLRGAERLLNAHGVLPGRRIVGHGGRLPKTFVAQLESKGSDVVAQGVVRAVRGGTHVSAARLGDAWIDCDAVVCNLAGTPRVELFQQAGCDLRFDASGVLAPVVDKAGATTRHGVHARFGPAPDAPLLEVLR